MVEAQDRPPAAAPNRGKAENDLGNGPQRRKEKKQGRTYSYSNQRLAGPNQGQTMAWEPERRKKKRSVPLPSPLVRSHAQIHDELLQENWNPSQIEGPQARFLEEELEDSFTANRNPGDRRAFVPIERESIFRWTLRRKGRRLVGVACVGQKNV